MTTTERVTETERICEWAQQQNYIVLAAHDRVLTLAGFDGVAWELDCWERYTTYAVIEAAQQSGAQLWAYDAAAVYNTIVEHFRAYVQGIRSAQVAELTLRPATGKKPKTMPELTVRETMALVLSILTELERKPELQHIVKLDQDVDAIWRRPASDGYIVDASVLAAQKQIVTKGWADSITFLGRDLTKDEAALVWMEQQGITCLDSDGKQTCEFRELEHATVPDAARALWPVFLDVRSSAGLRNLHVNIERNIVREDWRKGRVCPRINAVGTASGRMSVVDPAMQGTPRRAREVYRADPGKVLLSCDLAQVEPRIVAAISGDPGLIAAVQSGDIYTALAVSVWGEDARGDGKRRDQAKTALNAISYGQGARSLGRRLGVGEQEARRIIASWMTAYPEFAKWRREIVERARRGERLTTLYGRPLPEFTPQKAYQAIAYTIQGCGADLFKGMTIEVTRELQTNESGIELWLPLHDELILSAPDTPSTVAQALDILARNMVTEINGVEISGTPQVIGPSWKKD
jgi:hypothetical protein